MTAPLRSDAEALDPVRLRRWGPEGSDAYHIVVPPRPHQAAWLSRAAQQVALEADGSTISVCCIVDRALCPDQWSKESMCRALPCVASLLKVAGLAVHITAVGERPPLRRVPASEQRLPPTCWESAHHQLTKPGLVNSGVIHLNELPRAHLLWEAPTCSSQGRSLEQRLQLAWGKPGSTHCAPGLTPGPSLGRDTAFGPTIAMQGVLQFIAATPGHGPLDSYVRPRQWQAPPGRGHNVPRPHGRKSAERSCGTTGTAAGEGRRRSARLQKTAATPWNVRGAWEEF